MPVPDFVEQGINFLKINKAWIFDGIGVALLTTIATLFLKGRSSYLIRQKIKTTDTSINNQAGRDIYTK